MARGLGRGFEALLPEGVDVNELANKGDKVLDIKLGDIQADPNQPRRSFSKEALSELAASIKQHGVIQPILVTKLNSVTGPQYQLIAGERRWRASSQVNKKTIPAIVKKYDDVQRLEVALIENLQRQDLNAMESAEGMQRLQDDFGLNKKQIAERIGYDNTTVTNRMLLISLPLAAKTAVRDGKLNEGQARSIARLRKHPTKQRELFENALKNDWTVRRCEQFVAAVLSGKDEVACDRRLASVRPAWAKSFSSKMGVVMSLTSNTKDGSGHIRINYRTQEELDKLQDFFKQD